MKHQRYRYVAGAAVLVLLIWFAWPERSEPGRPDHVDARSEGAGVGQKPAQRIRNPEHPDHSKSNRQSRPKRVDPSDHSGLSRLESLLNNQTLSNQEAAEQLLGIVRDKRLSDEVRAEALGHGVILELPVFAGLAGDTELPLVLADTLLTHVINANHDPALQIRAYRDFLNHPSAEIRDEAQRMLAFVLEDDLGELDTQALIQQAEKKLLILQER
ncbi:MAG: hypothetical protein RL346_171 [Verrucomicrobiota bacterium]|jgi:hypothetical protein